MNTYQIGVGVQQHQIYLTIKGSSEQDVRCRMKDSHPGCRIISIRKIDKTAHTEAK